MSTLAMLFVNSTAINALLSHTVDATMKISGDALTKMNDVERDATWKTSESNNRSMHAIRCRHTQPHGHFLLCSRRAHKHTAKYEAICT